MPIPARHLAAVAAVWFAQASAPALADEFDTLTGDTRRACEALLCLSSGKPPHECDPALSKYFSIKKKKASDTRKARRDFLELCPAAKESSEMSELVRAISQGAGRCDAASLNRALRRWRGPGGDAGDNGWEIANKLPNYCSVYVQHGYTDLDQGMPRYVGSPKEGGYWADAAQYDQELARYERELARKKEQAKRMESVGGDS